MDKNKEELPEGTEEQAAKPAKEVAHEKRQEVKADEKTEEETLATIVRDLGEEKVEVYRLAWEVFDKEKKGEVAREDFSKVLCKIYENDAEEERKNLIKQMDIDGDGSISYFEYLKFMRDAEGAVDDEDMFMQAFKIADKDGDGTIDIQEFQALIKELGEDLKDDQLQTLMDLADKNKDGVISFREFKAMLGTS